MDGWTPSRRAVAPNNLSGPWRRCHATTSSCHSAAYPPFPRADAPYGASANVRTPKFEPICRAATLGPGPSHQGADCWCRQEGKTQIEHTDVPRNSARPASLPSCCASRSAVTARAPPRRRRRREGSYDTAWAVLDLVPLALCPVRPGQWAERRRWFELLQRHPITQWICYCYGCVPVYFA
ncbi:hypothetical protein E2562_006631 [Oryza meyeriana var. granulata]|uniref:Uncharacterized protein n=1 Tax=Oryza meyeriana var. granulata TaxID=110450 RepID=A0A6G1EG42_9ORYZ|nr:hypothetical protein E2562_006631 [Oryza meyeriana var. granulata]